MVKVHPVSHIRLLLLFKHSITTCQTNLMQSNYLFTTFILKYLSSNYQQMNHFSFFLSFFFYMLSVFFFYICSSNKIISPVLNPFNLWCCVHVQGTQFLQCAQNFFTTHFYTPTWRILCSYFAFLFKSPTHWLPPSPSVFQSNLSLRKTSAELFSRALHSLPFEYFSSYCSFCPT